ncbi:MAG: PQQ-binding-like beta-propeller repeat protein [Planctomycetes bacterium]|nr:PQQ-binding-like beta-propeller repeat protein [Planctomycetota bacterium]
MSVPRLTPLVLAPIALAAIALASGCRAPEAREPYALSPEMVLLERDAESPVYREHLKGFHVNDLHSELERVKCRGSSASLAAPPGSAEGAQGAAAYREALERRVRIERRFLEAVRAEYARRGAAEGTEASAQVLAAALPAAAAADPSLPIEPILPGSGAERQWPRWRGPGGQGLTAETGLPLRWGPEENIAWWTEVPGRGNSSPVIWEDRIFLTTAFDDGRRRSLVGIRRSDGTLQFVADAPPAPPEGRVMGKNGYASATPVVDGERVVAFFGNSGLAAFDLSGKLLWHRPLEPFDAMHGVGASPAICGELVVLFQEQSDKPSLGIALDRRTGEVRWRIERPKALGWCTALPVRVAGKEQVIHGGSQTIASFDPATGAEIWRSKGPTVEVIPTVVCGHGLVFTSSVRSGPTLAVRPTGSGDITATNIAWRVVRNAPHVPSPVLSGDLLYQVNDTGILSCFEARTGKAAYQKRLSGRFSASPVAGDGKVYFTNEDGDTFVVRDGPEFEVLAQSSLGEPVLASAAVLGGRIFIRTQKRLVAIGK